MKLVYIATNIEVKVGDKLTGKFHNFVVDHFAKPHKAASEGRVSIRNKVGTLEYYAGVIGARWVEREDRLPERKFTDAEFEFFAIAFAISNLGHGADQWKCVGDGLFTTEVANWQNAIKVDLRRLRSSAGSLRQYLEHLEEEIASEGGEPLTAEIDSMRNMLTCMVGGLAGMGHAHTDYLPLLCWLADHCTTQFTFGTGEYTQAEREGLVWLAEGQDWVDVTVTRKSAREFDLGISGYSEYESEERLPTKRLDDGSCPGFESYQLGETTGKKTIEKSNFSAWFLLACIRQFWGMGLIKNSYDDWSFLRDRDVSVQWADFNAVLAGKAPTGELAELGGIVNLVRGELVAVTLH